MIAKFIHIIIILLNVKLYTQHLCILIPQDLSKHLNSISNLKNLLNNYNVDKIHKSKNNHYEQLCSQFDYILSNQLDYLILTEFTELSDKYHLKLLPHHNQTTKISSFIYLSDVPNDNNVYINKIPNHTSKLTHYKHKTKRYVADSEYFSNFLFNGYEQMAKLQDNADTNEIMTLNNSNSSHVRSNDLRDVKDNFLDGVSKSTELPINNNLYQAQPYQIDRRTQIRYPADRPSIPALNQSRPGYALPIPSDPGRIEPIRAQVVNAIPERDPPKPGVGMPPTLRVPFDQFDVMVGKFFRIPIPSDTFYDFTDGATPNLKLVLYNIDKVPVESDKRYNWIRLDPLTKELYGLPMGMHIGLHELILAAINKRGLPVHNAFTILVQNRPKGFRTPADEGINHMFWAILQEKKEAVMTTVSSGNETLLRQDEIDLQYVPPFNRNLHTQLAFFDRLLRYYHNLPAPNNNQNDDDNRRIDSRSRLPHSRFPQSSLNKTLLDNLYVESYGKGSVKVNWVNETLLTPPNLPLQTYSDYIRERGYNYSNLMTCPETDIVAIASRFTQLDSQNFEQTPLEQRFTVVNRDFHRAMQPDFNVKSAGYDLYHKCSPENIVPVARTKSGSKVWPPQNPNHNRDMWLTTIIPALVMALLMLLAALVACCLYRRSLKPRFANDEDRALFKKGVPVVIYPQEYGENNGVRGSLQQSQQSHPLISTTGASTTYNEQPGTIIATTQIGGEDIPSATPPPPFNRQQILRIISPSSHQLEGGKSYVPSVVSITPSSTSNNPYQPLLSQHSATDHYDNQIEYRP